MSDSYTDLFLTSVFAQGDYLGPLSLFFLVLARLLPIIALAPFLGARVLQGPVKIFLAISPYHASSQEIKEESPSLYKKRGKVKQSKINNPTTSYFLIFKTPTLLLYTRSTAIFCFPNYRFH